MRPEAYTRVASILAEKKPAIETDAYWRWVNVVRQVAGEIYDTGKTEDLLAFFTDCGINSSADLVYPSLCERATRELHHTRNITTVL